METNNEITCEECQKREATQTLGAYGEVCDLCAEALMEEDGGLRMEYLLRRI
jgi:hypothetical protein